MPKSRRRLREEIFGFLNSKLNLVAVLSDDKKEMLNCKGLIYHKYCSRFDRFLSFIFGVEVFHLPAEICIEISWGRVDSRRSYKVEKYIRK
jgi:hypothetical protein